MSETRFVATISGFIGLLTMAWGWIILVGCHFLNIEHVTLPNQIQLTWLFYNIALAVAYNIIFFLSIALTSPLATSLTTMMSLPGGILWDWVSYNKVLEWRQILGSILLMIAIVLFALLEHYETLKAEANGTEPDAKINNQKEPFLNTENSGTTSRKLSVRVSMNRTSSTHSRTLTPSSSNIC